MKVVKNPNIVLRDIGNVFFLIDTKSKYDSGNKSLIEINDIGRLIWESMECCESFDDIVGKIMQVCGIPPSDMAVVVNDAVSFLKYLSDLGCIRYE